MSKDTLIRTGKTFIQAFLGALIPSFITACSSVPAVWADIPAWLGQVFNPQLIIGSCCAAGICAIWNYKLQSKTEGGQ